MDDSCTNCKAILRQHRLTCWRCGEYLPNRYRGPNTAAAVLGGLMVISLAGAMACYMILRPTSDVPMAIAQVVHWDNGTAKAPAHKAPARSSRSKHR